MPFVGRRHLALLGLALTGSLLGCGPLPAPKSGQACGDPCGPMHCPTAFACEVQANCSARCTPERVPGQKP